MNAIAPARGLSTPRWGPGTPICGPLAVEKRNSIHKTAEFIGYCAWFDVRFPPCTNSVVESSEPEQSNSKRQKIEGKDVILSTGPADPETHWGQTLFFLDEPVPVRQDTTIAGKIQVSPAHLENKRFVQVNMVWSITSKDGSSSQHSIKNFTVR